jgi:L-asparaginase II
LSHHTSTSTYLPIFETRRGETIESIHYGALSVVDSRGSLLACYGNPQTTSFLRSSAKPFQALPLIEADGHIRWGFTLEEIAILCASHAGTDEHIQVLTEIQAKVQVSETDLRCGIHPPGDEPTRKAMELRGQSPTPNHHNCSGKHTGMLAMAKLTNTNLENYLDFDHPIQLGILKTFSEMCEVPVEEIALGIDGCSAPVFAIPLQQAAYAYARLCDPSELSAERAAACQTITKAMIAHPEMVAGPGKFDTRLMQVCQGKLISKGGAEGYQQIGIMPGVLGENAPGIGIALKISDGDAAGRARPAVILEVLRQLGVMTDHELDQLAEFGPTSPVLNWRKLLAGKAYPTFALT